MTINLIACGGTGCRQANLFVLYAAAGILSCDTLRIFIADLDLENGDLNDLQELVAHYGVARNTLGGSAFFRPEITIQDLKLKDAVTELTGSEVLDPSYHSIYAKFCDQNTPNILDLFHTGYEQSDSLHKGFVGNPAKGVPILKMLFETSSFQGNPLYTSLDQDFRQNFRQNHTAAVVLCGSTFGGTGATIVPALAEKLRKEYPKLIISGALMLPYFTIPSGESAVKEDTFQAKAAAAMSSYEDTTKPGKDGFYLYDNLFLTGYPSKALTCSTNADSGKDQTHCLHFCEMLSAELTAAFAAGTLEGVETQPQVFTYRLDESKEELDLSQFPALTRQRLTAFARFCIVMLVKQRAILYHDKAQKNPLLLEMYGRKSIWDGSANCDLTAIRTQLSEILPFFRDFLNAIQEVQSQTPPAVKLMDSDLMKKVLESAESPTPPTLDEAASLTQMKVVPGEETTLDQKQFTELFQRYSKPDATTDVEAMSQLYRQFIQLCVSSQTNTH